MAQGAISPLKWPHFPPHAKQSRRVGVKMLFPLIVLLVFSVPAVAEETPVSGHLKYQGGYEDYDSGDIFQNSLDARINGRRSSGEWEGILEGQGVFFTSDDSTLPSYIQPRQQNTLPSDRRRLLDLTATLDDGGTSLSALRLDRASVSHSSPDTVIKVGRQAISFGNGLTFHVLDLFNPFAPTAIDKEYKTGDDMAYAQLLYGTTTDVQLVAVPRRDLLSRDIEGDESSAGGKLHTRIEEFKVDLDLLAARHYGETVVGGGFSRDLFEAVFRSDISLTQSDGGRWYLSALGNIDRSFGFFDKNLYLFAELFHSAFGGSEDSYLIDSPNRTKRILRGDLYVLGRNYLATGFRLEVTPRTNLLGSTIYNLADKSTIVQGRISQELSQNLNLIGGVNIPVGKSGSEFGDIRSPTGEMVVDIPVESYLRVEWYFP